MMKKVERRKRVLFVDEDPGRTGSTVSMEFLLRGFQSAGYEVFVLTLKKDPVFLARLAECAAVMEIRNWKMSSIGMNLYFTNTLSCFSPRGIVVMAKEAAKLFVVLGIVFRAIGRSGATLVYANEYVLISALLAARFRRVPAVVHVRSPFIRGTFGIRKWILARVLPAWSGAVIAITPFEARQLCPGKRNRSRIAVIGEFVRRGDGGGRIDDAPVIRKAFGLAPGRLLVTMLGGVMAIKGTVDFLRAAALVSRVREDVEFVIAGRIYRDESAATRAYFDECMEAGKELLEMGRLRMLGEITETGALLSVSDILVSPSPQTHFSRPVVEAWAASRPVVAVLTDHLGGLISDGVDGFLVNAGDDDALAERVLRLLDDKHLSRELGRRGRLKVEKDFDAETNLAKIIGIGDRLLAGGACGPCRGTATW